MKYFSFAAFSAVFFLLKVSVFAQSPSATPPSGEDVLKISTNLIQQTV